MKTQKLLEKTRIGLILNEPFFASAALKLDYEEDSSIETGSTNGKRIRYNPDFFTRLKPDERVCFIAHEILHIISLHPLRVGNKNQKKWNVACDYAINPLLQDAGIKLIEGSLYSRKFDGMSAEEIYALLPDEEEDGDGGSGGGGEDPNGFGGVEAPPDDSDIKEMEQEAKQMGLEAYNAAKQAGNTPQKLKELIGALIEPKHDWKELLARFVCEVVKNDYTWSKPNQRYVPMGLYLPALESLEVGRVVFAIDTSGSVDRKLLTEFVSEIKDAMTNFAIPVTVIHCDTHVQKVEELTEDDIIKPVGRGGTRFQPVFDYVEEHLDEAKAIVYFTDGDANDPLTEPHCPVLWAVYNNRRFKPDFGEVMNVDNSINYLL